MKNACKQCAFPNLFLRHCEALKKQWQSPPLAVLEKKEITTFAPFIVAPRNDGKVSISTQLYCEALKKP